MVTGKSVGVPATANEGGLSNSGPGYGNGGGRTNGGGPGHSNGGGPGGSNGGGPNGGPCGPGCDPPTPRGVRAVKRK